MTEQKLDTYLGLCTEVYDLSKPNPPEDAYAFYRAYAMKAKGPILEPMCGTGRFLLPLLEEGFDIKGFDASEHMLKALHIKADAKKLKPIVWKGFVEELSTAEKYNLIFIPSGSFNLIIELSEAKKAIQKFYDCLAVGGVLLFEAITVAWELGETNKWASSVWYHHKNKFIIANFLTLPDKDNVRHSIGKYELIENNQLVKTEVEDFKVKMYDKVNLLTMLKEIGFSEIKVHKTFEVGKEPGDNDEEIIYECRKK